jgi:PKD repeat protein
MDKRLIILISAFCAVALGFFVYRKMYYKHDGIRYTIKPRGLISAGDSIVFQDQTDAASRWKWDFGDGEYSAANAGTHTYMAPGMYVVKHTVYGSFGVLKNERADTIVVRSGNTMPVAALPSIMGPADMQVGKPSTFESDMAAATYEWHVEGDPQMAGKTQKNATATFAFSSAGVKTIVLKTTSPNNESRKSVTVAALAVATPAPQPRPAQTMPMPKPKPVQAPVKKPHGSGLPDLDNGVEYNKTH